MLKKLNKLKAQSTIEYMVMIVIIITALIAFQRYFTQGISGRWKATGDSIGFGRQFDPQKTTECAYDFQYRNIWYDVRCYEADCEEVCFSLEADPTRCSSCIAACASARCNAD